MRVLPFIPTPEDSLIQLGNALYNMQQIDPHELGVCSVASIDIDEEMKGLMAISEMLRVLAEIWQEAALAILKNSMPIRLIHQSTSASVSI